MNRAFLKWAGGKSESLNKINEAIGCINGRLIEPFAGSAVVSLNIDAVGYVVADFNPHLISLYKLIYEDGKDFIDYCETFFVPENNIEKSYYELRDIFNTTKDDKEKAALFLYLNRHTFNGLCRFNSKGGFNSPFGSYEFVEFPRNELNFFLNRFRNSPTCFYRQDFEETIALANEDDVIYNDPPYVPLSATASFSDYTSDGFSIEQQKRLAVLAEKSKCKFLISNHDTEFTRELYKKADKIISRKVGRFIGANKESRKPVNELLAIYNI